MRAQAAHETATRAARLPVLMYHHIGPVRPNTNTSLTISHARFEQQMRWLDTKGYQTINSRQWLQQVAGKAPLAERAVMLTFDDGYQDLMEFALPVLRSLGMTAILYVVTGQIGGTNRWDQERGWGALSLMSAADIGVWRQAGMEIGAHSRSHPELTSLTAQQREGEIAGSRDDLAGILGEAPVSFAYPYGDCNAAVVQQVGRYYAVGVTTHEGLNQARTPLLQLRRTMVHPADTMAEFAIRVRLGWSPGERVRRQVWRGKSYLRRAWQ